MDILTDGIANLGIRDTQRNPLIAKFDTTLGASALSRKGKPWKKLRNQYFVDELVAIKWKAQAGEDVIMWRIQYRELIMLRGSDHDIIEFKKRRGIFRHIPREPNRAERAKAEFEHFIGDERETKSWHKLFRFLGLELEGLPRTVTAAKKLLKNLRVYVNIYDFVDAMRENVAVHHFKTFFELKNYSMDNSKIFPLEEAREDSALRILLQPLFRRKT